MTARPFNLDAAPDDLIHAGRMVILDRIGDELQWLSDSGRISPDQLRDLSDLGELHNALAAEAAVDNTCPYSTLPVLSPELVDVLHRAAVEEADRWEKNAANIDQVGGSPRELLYARSRAERARLVRDALDAAGKEGDG